MSGSHIAEHAITIPAGAIYNISGIVADFVSCYQSDGELKVQINGRGDFVWFAQGITYSRGLAPAIQIVTLKNDSAVSVGAKIITGIGGLIDSRGPLIVDQFEEVPHVSVPNITATAVVAADDRRVEAVLSNLNANTAPFYIGGASIGASEGFELLPGASVVIPSRAAIYAFQSSGGAQSIAASVLKH